MNISELRAWLSYDSETGQFTWLKVSGKSRVGAIAGTPHAKGYVTIGIKRKQHLAHRLAWAFHYGEWPDRQVDHKNGNKADNRIDNLRLATNQQNHANRGAQKNSTSGVKGVYWFKPQQKWKAQIQVAGKAIVIGYFDKKDDAIAARREAEKQYQGEFAHEGAPTLAYAP
ncbi:MULTISPECIES: HNH endonuclease signature motif containing protein [unclassified Bradyrhizobium]|uniref:HNH endonuclease signature motif containing protein n=1 Tax=unclassified Bradyrhizobium TaxID=2631580 RepID=UPI00247AAB94|nr:MULTISPECIES: HNH endonuclease signature motif containing protein [unclassified Bradyrhizobium]WGR74304.1 HNH endonuclease [Bradyrhizobium sp. ISRA426]WGR79139.1 HNH endonuclease [Bradyrhizobium sp. ISRA430]WGR90627.1 HNH endonuclease [Bradyrhizobium sp. ISRA432]